MKHEYQSLQQILEMFQGNELLWWTEISNRLWKSRVVVHRYLKELVTQNKLKKIGKPPHTKYQKVWEEKTKHTPITENNIFIPDFKTRKTIDEIFYKFSPDGKLLQWLSGMILWCNVRNLDIEEKVKSYLSIDSHINSLQNSCGLISAKASFWKHFEKVYLDEIYYSDQYKWMEFWRGKLAEMTFYAKQSQDKKLISQAIDEILPKLECAIVNEKFDAIAITPWSIHRKNQLLQFLKNKLKHLWIPFINIIKYYPNNIPIPQKSLKTREQRMLNARNTIIVHDENIWKYKNVFLIDDFVWSGSTLNETALKLKTQWVQKITGFAFVGNLNLDYEIINEV